MLICDKCLRISLCEYPCEAYSNQKESKLTNKFTYHYPIKNDTCFVILLGEYYFDHLPEEKQTNENLDLLWEAGIYLEKYFGTCAGFRKEKNNEL